jgi:S-adenosylmethionine/arginine decarboxylase-like enzyme
MGATNLAAIRPFHASGKLSTDPASWICVHTVTFGKSASVDITMPCGKHSSNEQAWDKYRPLHICSSKRFSSAKEFRS